MFEAVSGQPLAHDDTDPTVDDATQDHGLSQEKQISVNSTVIEFASAVFATNMADASR